MSTQIKTMELQLEAQRYLHHTLGIEAKITPWKGEHGQDAPAGLLVGIKNYHFFYHTNLMGRNLLLFTPKDSNRENWTPHKIALHYEKFTQLQTTKENQELQHLPVFLYQGISGIRRQRLVEKHIPFIDPGKQLYLPQLLMDLREVKIKSPPLRTNTLTPATQRIFLALLQSPENCAHHLTRKELGKLLGYSKMTLTRAFQELEQHKLITLTKEGRALTHQLTHPPKELWDKAQPILTSPVRETIFLYDTPEELRHITTVAGYTALSHHTMITDNPIPCLAINGKDYKHFTPALHICPDEDRDHATATLQIWQYPPQTWANTDGVDEEKNNQTAPLSLYLTLRDDTDERTQQALEQLITQIKWSKD